MIYYNLTIHNDSFSITKHNFKPYEKDSARITLENIKQILDKNLKYKADALDDYAKLNPEQLTHLLRSLSHSISERYKTKVLKVNCIIRFIFQIGKQVKVLSEQINRFRAPSLSSIAPDCFNSMALYLDINSLSRLMRTSKTIQKRCQSFFISATNKMGYQGSNFQESIHYLKKIKIYTYYRPFFSNPLIGQFIYWYPVKPFSFLELLGRNSIQNPDVVELRKFVLGHREKYRDPGSLQLQQLEIAIETNDLEMMEFIKFYSPKVIVDSYNFLEKCQTPETFKFLVSWIDSKNPNSLDRFLASPYKEIVSFCLEKGCNIETSLHRPGKQESLTPLIVALLKRKDEIARLLIEKGANIHAPYINGSTAIHFAAENGSEELLSLLFTKEVNINQPNYDGVTPLMFACMGVQGKPLNPTTIQMLLVNGADPFKKDNAHKTALFYAQRREDPIVIELLEKAMNMPTN